MCVVLTSCIGKKRTYSLAAPKNVLSNYCRNGFVLKASVAASRSLPKVKKATFRASPLTLEIPEFSTAFRLLLINYPVSSVLLQPHT